MWSVLTHHLQGRDHSQVPDNKTAFGTAAVTGFANSQF